MVAQKRQADNPASRPPKRSKTDDAPDSSIKPSTSQPRPVFTSALLADEGDFPRGGGTTLTPYELKEQRDEGRKEAEKEVGEEAKRRKKIKEQRERNRKGKGSAEKKEDKHDKDAIRVEHLNYRRLPPSTRILARIHSILNLHLIISLPNQLLAHVPITEISDSLTKLLEKGENASISSSNEEDEDMEKPIKTDHDSDDDDDEETEVPDLTDLFQPGQYVQATITQTYPSESSNRSFLSLYPPSEITRLASRAEASLVPSKLMEGVSKLDVAKGFRGVGEVRGREDHGWVVGLGVEGVEGFLRDEEVQGREIVIGQLLDFVVEEIQSNGRVARISVNPLSIQKTQQPQVTTINSLLPGHLVSALVTSIIPATGLNLKIFGTFDATVDLTHLPIPANSDLEDHYKIGKKVRARIIFETTPAGVGEGKVFGVSLMPHVLDGTSPVVDGKEVEREMTIGTVCEKVEVMAVEKEWGLVVQTEQGYRGFVHISHVADERPASLTGSGPYSIGSTHKARVLGHSPFDGLILFSMEKKVLEQKFMLVSEVKVGELMKGTIHRLTEKAMFINISGSVDGVAWPDHYADIKLKHPERRFKIGQTVKCRVFSIEPEKGRVKLTLKKSLLDAAEPVAQSFDDLKVDMVAAGLITKILEKGVLVELFGGYVVYVPIGEVSEAFITDLKTAVFEGKPVKVKLTTVDRMTEKMFGSIRQALPSAIAATAIEVDDVVSGEVTGIHKDQVGLKLLPSGRKAILALSNLAHHRNVKVTALRTTLKVGEKLDELVVVVKDADSGLIIVANKQNAAKKTEAGAASQSLTMANMKPGQVLPARVTKKNAQGYFLSITRNLIGRLAPTDMADDFGKLPEINQGDIVKCCVVAVNPADRQMDLSIRPSRVDAAASSGKSVIVDREIENLSDLKVNQKIRGIVKSIAGSGLYVSLGRTITARVMIKELFDDYVAEWQPRFEVGQVVEGKILKVDEKLKQVELTLRKKPAKAANKKESIGLADLSVGQKVDTTVRKIEDFGMFLNIEGTRLSGLCHRSELSDEKDANVQQALKTFRQGDKLKAKITAIDTEKGKIALGIKPSYFDAEDFGSKKEDEDIKEEDIAAVDEDVEMPGDDEVEVESDEDVEEDAEVSGEEDSGFLDLEAEDDDEGEDDEEEDGEEDEESELDGEEEDDEEIIMIPGAGASSTKASKKSSTAAAATTLPIKGGFSWNGADASAEEDEASSDSSDDDSDSEAEDAAGKASKKRKGGHQPVKDLTGEIRTKQPESTAEFERALLASPNSSFLWIQFMSFQLALSEVDKARDIGRRALEKIGFREEEEKLNVWMALINLENAHGTPESFDKLFKEAAQYNDAKTVYLRTASVLQQTEKLDAAGEILGKACKKFGQDVETWTSYAEFEFVAKDDADAARALLPRSLRSLPTSEHSKIIEKFATLEFRHGDQERGRTIFEGLVDRYPKRFNLWNVYIDQVTKVGDIQSARGLVDRALDQKLTPHKAKFLFKKLLLVEDRIGDADGKERAKTKAREWVLKHQG